jgi:hypothetical protein
MPRGSAPGERRGGRQKGTPNKVTAAKVAAIEASGLTPLDYLLLVMRDGEAERHTRLDAAKAAAPYVHAKLASIEMTGKDGGPIETRSELSELELARRIAFALEQGARMAAKKD